MLNITALNGTSVRRGLLALLTEKDPRKYWLRDTERDSERDSEIAHSSLRSELGNDLRGTVRRDLARDLLATARPTGQPSTRPTSMPTGKQVLTGVSMVYTVSTYNINAKTLGSQLNSAISGGTFMASLRALSGVRTVTPRSATVTDLSPTSAPTPAYIMPKSSSPFDVFVNLSFGVLVGVIVGSIAGCVLVVTCFVSMDESGCCPYLADRRFPSGCCPKVTCPSPSSLFKRGVCNCCRGADYVPRAQKRALIFPHIN